MSFDLGEDEVAGVMIAVNTILQGSYRADGIEAWWDRPRSQLLSHTPRETVASDPTLVVKLALSSLEQEGT